MYRKWPQNARWFVSEEGWVLVFYLFMMDFDNMTEDCSTFFLLSTDGQRFTELALDLNTMKSADGQYTMELEDPQTATTYEVSVAEDMSEATINGQAFQGAEQRSEVEFNILPRVPEYLYRLPNGDLVYVSTGYECHDYGTFKLFVGPGEKMEEATITRCPDRLSDGGTTLVITDQGNLYSPAPSRGVPATWNGVELTGLNPGRYLITEEGAHCSIRNRT